jgi:hypothetical protein
MELSGEAFFQLRRLAEESLMFGNGEVYKRYKPELESRLLLRPFEPLSPPNRVKMGVDELAFPKVEVFSCALFFETKPLKDLRRRVLVERLAPNPVKVQVPKTMGHKGLQAKFSEALSLLIWEHV